MKRSSRIRVRIPAPSSLTIDHSWRKRRAAIAPWLACDACADIDPICPTPTAPRRFARSQRRLSAENYLLQTADFVSQLKAVISMQIVGRKNLFLFFRN